MMRAMALCALGVSGSAIAYTLATDGSPFRTELLTPWMVATLFDFYGLVLLLAMIIFAVEANPWVAASWTIAVCCLGSPAAWTWVLLHLLQQKQGILFWGWLVPADIRIAGRSGAKSGLPTESEPLSKSGGVFEG